MLLREAQDISISYKAGWHTRYSQAALTILLLLEGLRMIRLGELGEVTRLTLNQVRRKLGFEGSSLEEALLQKQTHQASILQEGRRNSFSWSLAPHMSWSTSVTVRLL